MNNEKLYTVEKERYNNAYNNIMNNGTLLSLLLFTSIHIIVYINKININIVLSK